jgi:hypothetical protein
MGLPAFRPDLKAKFVSGKLLFSGQADGAPGFRLGRWAVIRVPLAVGFLFDMARSEEICSRPGAICAGGKRTFLPKGCLAR